MKIIGRIVLWGLFYTIEGGVIIMIEPIDLGLSKKECMDKLLDELVNGTRKYIDGTTAETFGNIVAESRADKKAIWKCIGISIGLLFVVFVIYNISKLLFFICLLVYIIFEIIYIKSLHDFWRKYTYVAVYENVFFYGSSKSDRIDYNSIEKVDLTGHCLNVYTSIDRYYFYFLENEEYIYNCLVKQIEIKTGKKL
jgi:hypothetical protein